LLKYKKQGNRNNPDKTEIMIFSNRSVPENLDFSLNGKSVPITTSHKHLGVTFSNDAKWNNHVDNIKSSVSKQHFSTALCPDLNNQTKCHLQIVCSVK
jgi:hypothetical protein